MATARVPPALRGLLQHYNRRHLLSTPRTAAVLLSPPPGPSPAGQRRWARVHDVRFLATTQASRSVIEKYRAKLEGKARDEGLQNIDELKAAYADRIQEVKQKDGVSVPGFDALLADEDPNRQQTKNNNNNSSNSAPAQGREQGQTQPQPSPSPSSSSSSSVKPLSEILDLDKARALPAKELGAIWRLRHAASPTSLCAVIPAATYSGLEATARRHPTFVLPVPREGQGAEMHFLQWVFDDAPAAEPDKPGARTATVLFTQLAEYKARGEWALPHTSATHYWDEGFARDQGVVLMAGSLVEGRGASLRDAQWLVALLQRFYADGEGGGSGNGVGVGDPARRALLSQFARGDPAFSVEKLLEESEKLG